MNPANLFSHATRLKGQAPPFTYQRVKINSGLYLIRQCIQLYLVYNNCELKIVRHPCLILLEF